MRARATRTRTRIQRRKGKECWIDVLITPGSVLEPSVRGLGRLWLDSRRGLPLEASLVEPRGGGAHPCLEGRLGGPAQHPPRLLDVDDPPPDVVDIAAVDIGH